MLRIDKITSVHQFCSTRKHWTNTAPRKMYILSYQVSGQYDHTFSFGTLQVKKDCLFFIHREDTYKAVEVERGDSICVAFEGECDLPTLLLDTSEQPAVRGIFQKLLQYRNTERESDLYACMAVCYEIFSFVLRMGERRYTGSGAKKRLQPACEYLAEHYREETLQTAELAAMCGVSARHFTALFRNVYGTTPAQYLIGLRLRQAQELLASGLHSVSETAELCGFRDVYYFSRIFRKKLGQSPREYMKQNKPR